MTKFTAMKASFLCRVSLCGMVALFVGLAGCFAAKEGGWAFSSWKVDGTVSAVPSGVDASILFDGKGGVHGGSGVNMFSGGYSLEGSVLKWTTPFRSTRRAGPQEHMAFEQAFLGILQACDKLVEDQKLTLSGSKGELVFERGK
jgi:heat shock protein HslJ